MGDSHPFGLRSVMDSQGQPEADIARIPFAARLISFPHQILVDAGDEAVQELWGVYLYDRNEVTHLCELTPSYCLYWLYDYVEFRGGIELTDEARERLLEKYERLPNDPIMYVHCHTVESFDGNDRRAYVIGEQAITEDCDYAEVLESFCDHYRSNCVL